MFVSLVPDSGGPLRLVHSIDFGPKFVSEQFSILFDSSADEDRYLGWHSRSAELLGATDIELVQRGEAFLIYRADVTERIKSSSLNDYFGGNLNRKGRETVVDLQLFDSLDEGEFWGLIGQLKGSTSQRRIRAMAKELSELPNHGVERFARRLHETLDELRTALDGRSGHWFGDSGLYWAALQLTQGRAHVESLIANRADRAEIDDAGDGEFVLDLPEVAYKMREGLRPSFVMGGTPHHTNEIGPSRSEFERLAHRPDLWDDLSILAGFRFVVSTRSGYVECIGVERIPLNLEPLAQIAASADRLSEAIGGVVATPVEIHVHFTAEYFSGLYLFEISRKWDGSRAAYLEKYVPTHS